MIVDCDIPTAYRAQFDHRLQLILVVARIYPQLIPVSWGMADVFEPSRAICSANVSFL